MDSSLSDSRSLAQFLEARDGISKPWLLVLLRLSMSLGVLSMAAYLARIDCFPIKSCDGRTVQQATVLASGALQGDRTYALFDAQNRVINAKRTAAIQRLRTTFSADGGTVVCSVDGDGTTHSFHLSTDIPALEAWLRDYFQYPVTVRKNLVSGFPDDTTAAGPTVISTATLATVAAWYPDLSVEEIRRRFRCNLEIGGVPAFWEDQLFAADATPVRFTIGAVDLEGVNPCQRCPVPTRDTRTGEVTPAFQTTFVNQRQATLPTWTHPARFNHFYRLSVNTNIVGQGGKVLRLGDPVSLS